MQSPDGKKFYSTGTFKEVVPMEKLVYTDSFADESGNVVPAEHYGMKDIPLETEVTVTFEDAGDGKTKMTLKHMLSTDEHSSEQASVGWNQSLDKLENLFK